jgi:acyl-CoA synthetase (AMP-forming)/AMP-acid ligase II
MKFMYQLYKLGFLSLKKIYLLAKAKKLHGENICFLLKFSSTYYKNKLAISDGEQSMSFPDLYNKVKQLSIVVSQKVDTPEKSVAILISSNAINNILLFYAIQNIGMKLVLVNAKTHQSDLQRIIDSQTNNCFVFAPQKIELQNCQTIVVDELFSIELTSNETFTHSRKNAPVVFTTSGTTGASKLIEKRKGALYWLHSFTDLITHTGIHKRNAVFISIPISHGFGCTALLFALVLGKKAIVTDRKNWEEQVEIIVKEKVDLVTGVPASLFHLAENIKNRQHAVTLVISGGAALSKQVLQSIGANLSKNIFSMYGSTEASTSFIASYAELQKNCCTLGKPLKNVTYKLNKMLDGGNELLINSGLANIKCEDGWIPTGDLVMIDENGLLIWSGRKDDMIIKNGVNIYPVEIEKKLLEMLEIEDCLVTREKHPVKGDIIIAYIKLQSAASITDSEIKKKLLHTLPVIKVPDRIEFLNAFNYTSTGKKIKP